MWFPGHRVTVVRGSIRACGSRADGRMWFASPGCVILLVEASCIKGASGVAFGDRTSSTLDTPHHDQGRTQLRPEPLRSTATVHRDSVRRAARVGRRGGSGNSGRAVGERHLWISRPATLAHGSWRPLSAPRRVRTGSYNPASVTTGTATVSDLVAGNRLPPHGPHHSTTQPPGSRPGGPSHPADQSCRPTGSGRRTAEPIARPAWIRPADRAVAPTRRLRPAFGTRISANTRRSEHATDATATRSVAADRRLLDRHRAGTTRHQSGASRQSTEHHAPGRSANPPPTRYTIPEPPGNCDPRTRSPVCAGDHPAPLEPPDPRAPSAPEPPGRIESPDAAHTSARIRVAASFPGRRGAGQGSNLFDRRRRRRRRP